MVVLIVLILIAAAVGIGGLIKGLLWLALIGLVLLVLAAVFGVRALKSSR